VGFDKHRKSRRSSGKVERYVQLNRSLLHSPQFSALSVATRALILELHGMYNGTNNGKLFLSVRDAADRLGFSCYRATMNAIDEAVSLGWITETIGSTFTTKADAISRARAWRLNWINDRARRCGGPELIPVLDFKTLTDKQKRRVNRRQDTLKCYLRKHSEGNFAVEESATVEARKAFSEQSRVKEFSSLKDGNGRNQPIPSVQENSAYISTMGYGAPRGCGPLRPKQPAND